MFSSLGIVALAANRQECRQVAGCAVAWAENPVQLTDRQAVGKVCSSLGRVAWPANRQAGRWQGVQ